MKKALAYLLFTLIVASCSSSGGTFRMKGKFKNFNQGELLVYSLMGKGRIDTIKLTEGRFNYEVPLEDTVLISVVFPNYSEIPVIAAPGGSVNMQGDASHLREVKVEGDDDNHLLTEFRLQMNEVTPPEIENTVSAFITANPASYGCIYVLNKYFLLKNKAPYDKAYNLLSKMHQAAPRRLTKYLYQQLAGIRSVKVGDRLPKLSAKTINGANVTNADLKGDVNVITVWSSWNYESQSIQRQLHRLKNKYGSRLQLVSICIDGNLADCRQTARRDSLSWPVVCSGQMWDTPLVRQLGFFAVPDAIIADRSGRITARQLTGTALYDEIEKRLK